jgi:hypothetical protein
MKILITLEINTEIRCRCLVGGGLTLQKCHAVA